MDNKVRIQFEMSEARVRDLDRIMTTTGTRSRRELFNFAFTLLEWAVGEAAAGKTVGSFDDVKKMTTAIHLPILHDAKREGLNGHSPGNWNDQSDLEPQAAII